MICTVHTSFFLLTLVNLVQGARAFTIQSKSWNYKGHFIGYEEAKRTHGGDEMDDNVDTNPHNISGNPVLLLNGFGVGSFHQHRLMPNLISVEEEDGVEYTRTVYGVDYLGQGRSWPIDCDDGDSENERGLIYSIDTWADQIITFIEEVILPQYQDSNANCKVHLIGNSVGGHLAVVLAAKRPDLVDSICLLNATPVWGINLKGWSGHLPAPFIPRKIGRYLFDRIRDLDTIEKYLENAYAQREAFDEKLMKQIRECTEGKGGHAAFASIMWSPPATFPEDNPKGFYNNLAKIECDVLLLFGSEDPWCTPAFAKRMFQSLIERDGHPSKPVHRYIELDNCGHCPNHEAATAVGQITNRWVGSRNRLKGDLQLLDGDTQSFVEPWGTIRAKEVEKRDALLSIFDKIVTSLV